MGSGTRVLLLPTEEALSPHCQVMASGQGQDTEGSCIRQHTHGSVPAVVTCSATPKAERFPTAHHPRSLTPWCLQTVDS